MVINRRAKRRWGRSTSLGNSTYKIEIQETLLRDDVSDDAAMNTMVHELLHCHPRRRNHKGEWKALAQRINANYPNLCIKRVTSPDEKGLEVERQQAKYIIRCNYCGGMTRRMRRSKYVQMLERGTTSLYCVRCGHHELEVKAL